MAADRPVNCRRMMSNSSPRANGKQSVTSTERTSVVIVRHNNARSGASSDHVIRLTRADDDDDDDDAGGDWVVVSAVSGSVRPALTRAEADDHLGGDHLVGNEDENEDEKRRLALSLLFSAT